MLGAIKLKTYNEFYTSFQEKFYVLSKITSMKGVRLWGFNILSKLFSHIFRPHSSVAKDSSLMAFCFLSPGKQVQTFRRILMPSKRQ